MRVFDNFPQSHCCPICMNNDNKPCVLIGIVGTQEGLNIEATPFHLDCIELFWYKKDNMIGMGWEHKRVK